MPFLYEFLIDGEKVRPEVGFSTARRWEEALDEASLVIPFTYLNKTPYKMFAMLDINITEIVSYQSRTPVATKSFQYIIYSDRVEALGAYGYYKHNVSAIEYTAKLDYYIIQSLAKSRQVSDRTQAPFEMDLTYSDNETTWNASSWFENINVQATYEAKSALESGYSVTFNQVEQALIADGGEPLGYALHDAFIWTNATLNIGSSPHNLSNGPANWSFPEGRWYIKYGYYDAGYHEVYTFYIDAIRQNSLSMYDVIDEIRTCVSKFGGLEDTRYYDTTRVFDIDPDYEDLLKQTPAPQIYLSKATARQMLIYVLAFVNALPRLIREETLDELTLERYNLSTGSYTKQDVIGNQSQQNTNQIGTKNVLNITQGLSSNLDDPSIQSPSKTGHKQVRSYDIQLTANNFTLKLPERSPLYMPNHLYVVIPYFKITAWGGVATLAEYTNFELDLMPRWINGEEWKLKEITENFPTIDDRWIFEADLGLRPFKVENLYWNVGDTEIKLADVFGTLFQDNLLRNVVKMALFEWVMLNQPKPILVDDSYHNDFEITYTIPSTDEYKDWRFRVEYITDESLIVKQDKEDVSQVSFYSEMRQNQEEALVNIVRQSRKGYGDLQRTGNVVFWFTKKHTSLSQFYEVGQVDSEGYTITSIDIQWFNDHALATYGVTRYHNRIQQGTFINQKYRPFDNFAKNVLNRHEHYNDYLIAVPPSGSGEEYEHEVNTQSTKITDNDTIYTACKILFGETYTTFTKKSASVALVRTDGMFDELTESSDGNRYYLSTEVSSRGIKQGFEFTFGFQSNQVAGDGLVSETHDLVTTYYNEAVRYTDRHGRFSRFGFAIFDDLTLTETDQPTYPLIIRNGSSLFNTSYFSCGFPPIEGAFTYPLVWNKDPMTNAILTYQLNVLSYFTNLYVFGLDFFTLNHLVYDHDSAVYTKLYLYTNGVTYGMFEDQFVKSGWNVARSVDLHENVLDDGNIEFGSFNGIVSFVDIDLTGVTSWAIGIPNDDGDPTLLVACNAGINGVQFIKRHIRTDIREIGDRALIEKWLDLSVSQMPIITFDHVLGPMYGPEDYGGNPTSSQEVSVDFSHVMTYFDAIDMSADIEWRVGLQYYENESYPADLSYELEWLVNLTYYRSDDYDDDISNTQISTVDMAFTFDMVIDDFDTSQVITPTLDFEMGFSHDMDSSQVVTPTLDFGFGYAQNLSISQIMTPDLQHTPTYFRQTTLDFTSIINADLQHTYQVDQFATPTINVLSFSDGIDGGGHYYYIEFTVTNNDATSARVGNGLRASVPTSVPENMVTLSSGATSSIITLFEYWETPPYLVAQTRDVVGEDDKAPSIVAYWNSW